ncbi:hypothetical protein [Alkalibacillus almallahensis]|uniref:hypothetical protein n=1 Tax=Alkalibacillus almallahensis TaxID=1379154 RepID=UPI0014202C91|nr:hypothetical protein [Alkalibacillus almallahensis]NIK10893.1 hypothetical protein [Alkalibacillus almallahensis]
MKTVTETGWKVVQVNESEILACNGAVTFERIENWYNENVTDTRVESMELKDVEKDGLVTPINEFGEKDSEEVFKLLKDVESPDQLEKNNGSWVIFDKYKDVVERLEHNSDETIVVIGYSNV